MGGVFTSPAGFTTASLTNVTWYGFTVGLAEVKAVLVDTATLTILAVSNSVTVDNGLTWRTNTFSVNPIITSSTSYALMLIGNSTFSPYITASSGVSKTDATNNYTTPTNPSDALTGTDLYSIYAGYEFLNVTLTSTPAIAANVAMNSTTYTTPRNLNISQAVYTFSADSAKIYNSNGYVFDHWLINGTTTNTTETLTLTITGDTTLSACYNSSSNVYAFYGPFSESTGLQLNENVTVTVHYSTAGTPNDEFTLNGSYAFAPSSTVQYFNYLFSDNTTRQYWVDPSETVTTFYVFRDDSLTRYTINFLDYTGLLKTYPYVTAKTYVNGSLFTVEKQKVDQDNTFSMSLLNGRTYQLVIGNQYYSYTYGNLLMTSATSVQLVLRGVDFPKESLLLYQYVHAYALRDYLNPIGAITVSYEDINNQTTSVLIQIKYDNGTVANSTTYTGNQTFSYTWNSAVNATNYQVVITVTHSAYGTFYFKQYLIGEYTKPSDPFSLAAFGSIPGIETAWFLPALLIIFVAACFSELTAEVACVLTCISAWLLFAIGWISLTPAAIVTALALSIMAGVISVRRRYF